MKANLIRTAQYGLVLLIALGVLGLVNLAARHPAAHALPEYAARTGEPCATCHVSPSGGGPRTLRGLLWVAQGRPDQVPDLGNLLVAPGVSDGAELYEIACSACHGTQGEGQFGKALVNSGLKASKVRSTILRGRERSGMPPFEGKFDDDQLEALVEFVTGLASGKIEPPPDSYPLPRGELSCGQNAPLAACEGN